MQKHLIGLLVLGTLVAAKVSPASAAGTVRLELVGDSRSVGMTFQEWGEALDRAGIRGVRISAAQADTKTAIEKQGTADRPSYVVTGIILSRDELALPGRRFRRTELAKLKSWLDDLASGGPAEQREARGAFGLSAKQFEVAHTDLAKKVDFATAGLPRGLAVERIGRGLQGPLRLETAVAAKLNEDKLAEELTGLSAGAALAYVLRPAGYCLAPRPAGAAVEYGIVAARPGLEVWPVGWPAKDANKSLPAIQEFLNVNIQNVSAIDALMAVAGRLKTPVLMDHNALARHGLEPAKSIVSLPQGRTTYSLALRKALGQAGLRFEIRLDEADTPFLWVTSIKPM
jgi:hypothetical protein